jgi:hypothetical protein
MGIFSSLSSLVVGKISWIFNKICLLVFAAFIKYLSWSKTMVKEQREENYIGEGFEERSPPILARKINNFVIDDDIQHVIDVKYSYLKKNRMNFLYSAMPISRGKKELRDNLQHSNFNPIRLALALFQ